MKSTKRLAYGLTILWFASLAVAIAPTATAQQENALGVISVSQTLDTTKLNAGRLPPETVQVDVKFIFRVQVPTATACPFANILIKYDFREEMSWAEAADASLSTNQDQFFYDQQKAAGNSDFGPFETTLSVKVNRNAPAFQTGTYIVTATAQPTSQTAQGCNLKKSDPKEVNARITNDYIPIMEYQPVKYVQKSGQNKEVLYIVKMTNFGNAQTKVTTAVPELPKGIDAIVPPAQLTLDSRAESGDKAVYFKDAPITLRTPSTNGYTNDLRSFTAYFTATSTTTGVDIPVDEQQITFSVQIQGVYVPGFDPSSAIASLGIGLVLLGFARRRRD